MDPSRDSRGMWALAGLVAGAAGLATSYAAGLALTVRQSPVVAVAEWIVALTPGPVVRLAIRVLGFLDKPLLIGGILLVLGIAFAAAGVLARRRPWAAVGVYAVLALLGFVAVVSRPGFRSLDLVPLLVGVLTWLGVMTWLTRSLSADSALVHPESAQVDRESASINADSTSRSADWGSRSADSAGRGCGGSGGSAGSGRRTFLIRAGVVALLAAGVGATGRLLGAGRRTVEASRRLLRLEGVSEPVVPDGVQLGLKGITPWQTPDERFYLIHTAIAVPTIDPAQWRLRVHGMVERELLLSYDDLLARRFSEAWITLNCVSNPVGGELVGNAWWSGVPIREILEEAGVKAGADAILQTSEDGWTCGTPLETVTDPQRQAMLAVGMNGRALPIEHGFPVRMIVPGLYGFVSATKWLVDIEVTRFRDFEAYWTPRGWSERGPVKTASRIDVPTADSTVPAGPLRVGGVAWHQHSGITGVQVKLDGGPWHDAELGSVLSVDTWVQWAATLDVPPGDHTLQVRAKDGAGVWQTPVERDVAPDGATGWHTIAFSAEE